MHKPHDYNSCEMLVASRLLLDAVEQQQEPQPVTNKPNAVDTVASVKEKAKAALPCLPRNELLALPAPAPLRVVKRHLWPGHRTATAITN